MDTFLAALSVAMRTFPRSPASVSSFFSSSYSSFFFLLALRSKRKPITSLALQCRSRSSIQPRGLLDVLSTIRERRIHVFEYLSWIAEYTKGSILTCAACMARGLPFFPVPSCTQLDRGHAPDSLHRSRWSALPRIVHQASAQPPGVFERAAPSCPRPACTRTVRGRSGTRKRRLQHGSLRRGAIGRMLCTCPSL